MTNGQGLSLIEPLRSLYKDEVRGTYQSYILIHVFEDEIFLFPFSKKF